jgi:hypothetical protein
VFWLPNKQKTHLDKALINPKQSGGAIVEMSFREKEVSLSQTNGNYIQSTNRNPSPILMASWSSKPLSRASMLVTVGLRIRHKTNSSSIALRAAALMRLLDTESAVKVELALQTDKHKYILIMPIIIRKNWVTPKKCVY